MSYKLKSSAILVDKEGHGTPEFISALKPSTLPFQTIPYPTGAVSSVINVAIKVVDQGQFIINPVNAIGPAITLTRGATTIPMPLATTVLFMANPGDVIKFTYTVNANPSLNPVIYFSAL